MKVSSRDIKARKDARSNPELAEYAANSSVPLTTRITNVVERLSKKSPEGRVAVDDVRRLMTDATRKNFDLALLTLEDIGKIQLEVDTAKKDVERGVLVPDRGLLWWARPAPLVVEDDDDEDDEEENEDEEPEEIALEDEPPPKPKVEFSAADRERTRRVTERVEKRSATRPEAEARAKTKEAAPASSVALAVVEPEPIAVPVDDPRQHLATFLGDVRVEQHPLAVYLARLAPGTRRTARESADIVAKMLGSSAERLPWGELRYAHIQAIKSKLGQRYAPGTANKIMAILRGILREAMRLDLLSPGEFERIRDVGGVKGERVKRGRMIEPSEQRALFGSIDQLKPAGVRDATIVAVFLGAGLRRSEVVNLDVRQLKLSTRTIVVLGKGNKEREIPLPSSVVDQIEKWLGQRGTTEGPLFVRISKTERVLLHKRLTTSGIYWMLDELAKTANVNSLSPHDFRRTYASTLLGKGVDISTVRDLMGHASIATTAGYDRRGIEAKAKAVELLDVPISGF